MAKALLDFETIDSDQINDIMAGKKVRLPKPSKNYDNEKSNKGDGSQGTSGNINPQPTAKN